MNDTTPDICRASEDNQPVQKTQTSPSAASDGESTLFNEPKSGSEGLDGNISGTQDSAVDSAYISRIIADPGPNKLHIHYLKNVWPVPHIIVLYCGKKIAFSRSQVRRWGLQVSTNIGLVHMKLIHMPESTTDLFRELHRRHPGTLKQRCQSSRAENPHAGVFLPDAGRH